MKGKLQRGKSYLWNKHANESFPTKQDIKEAVHGDVFAVILLGLNIPWIIQKNGDRWRHGRVSHSREYYRFPIK